MASMLAAYLTMIMLPLIQSVDSVITWQT